MSFTLISFRDFIYIRSLVPPLFGEVLNLRCTLGKNVNVILKFKSWVKLDPFPWKDVQFIQLDCHVNSKNNNLHLFPFVQHTAKYSDFTSF